MPSEAAAALDDATVETILLNGSLELEGRLVSASNASFVGEVELDGVAVGCIYKPIAGERPLWDFPTGTLAGRERAARVVSEAGGWHVVPPTVLRDGRFGPGMCQHWIDVADEHALVDVVAADAVEAGWLAVLEALDERDRPVLLVHADSPALRSMAVLDVVLNNADRKGGHVLVGGSGAVWGCDHGVCFHHEPKLRTVLWGWAGAELRVEDVAALTRLDGQLHGDLRAELAAWLTGVELSALRRRVETLLAGRRMPMPDGTWRIIPWPPF